MVKILLGNKKHYALLFGILISSILSIYLISASYSQPEMEKSETTTVLFNQTSDYKYVAILKPNSLYETKTLDRSDGILYTNIIDLLKLTYHYSFESPYGSDVSIGYSMDAVLISKSTNSKAPGKEGDFLWQKRLPLSDYASVKISGKNFSLTKEYQINITEATNLTKTIEKEIGVRGDSYIKITTNILVRSKGYNLEDQLPHVLILRIGGTIDSEGDSVNRTKSVTQVTEKPTIIKLLGFETIVSDARSMSLGSLAITLPLIGYGALQVVPRFKRKTKVSSVVNSINRKYRNWIIETEYPNLMLKDAIRVTSIEDMVKLSDDLGKPIIYSMNEGSHIYYIIDNNIKYAFMLTGIAPTAAKKPEKVSS